MGGTVVQYTVDDFSKLMFEGFVYELEPSIRDTIQNISDQVGAPEYVRTPQFPKRDPQDSKNNKRRNKSSGMSDEDWNIIRQFKATEFTKKEGACATIDAIRKHLNKISERNYDSQCASIIEILKSIGDTTEDGCDDVLLEFNNVGEAIFSIASGNMFYSKIYASLYKELMEQFPIMKDIFKTNFQKFKEIFKSINYCDPNEDYDKYCDINKENERRRSTGAFYINLMKLDVVEKEEILSIIAELQTNQLNFVDKENVKHVVDELTEVLFIMISNVVEHFDATSNPEWNTIIKRVDVISKMKPGDKPSITSKSIFKHMDIMDLIKID